MEQHCSCNCGRTAEKAEDLLEQDIHPTVLARIQIGG